MNNSKKMLNPLYETVNGKTAFTDTGDVCEEIGDELFGFDLRDMQKLAIEAGRDHFFKRNNKEGYIVLPTGVGKTLVAKGIIADQDFDVVIYTTQMGALVEAMKGKVREGRDDAIVDNSFKLVESVAEIGGSDKNIVFNTAAALAKTVRDDNWLIIRNNLFNKRVAIIVDEAHRFNADTKKKNENTSKVSYESAIEEIIAASAEGSKIIYMSASPDEMNEKVHEKLKDYVIVNRAYDDLQNGNLCKTVDLAHFETDNGVNAESIADVALLSALGNFMKEKLKVDTAYSGVTFKTLVSINFKIDGKVGVKSVKTVHTCMKEKISALTMDDVDEIVSKALESNVLDAGHSKDKFSYANTKYTVGRDGKIKLKQFMEKDPYFYEDFFNYLKNLNIVTVTSEGKVCESDVARANILFVHSQLIEGFDDVGVSTVIRGMSRSLNSKGGVTGVRAIQLNGRAVRINGKERKYPTGSGDLEFLESGLHIIIGKDIDFSNIASEIKRSKDESVRLTSSDSVITTADALPFAKKKNITKNVDYLYDIAQAIRTKKIDQQNEHYIDEDGVLHFFPLQFEENVKYDDGGAVINFKELPLVKPLVETLEVLGDDALEFLGKESYIIPEKIKVHKIITDEDPTGEETLIVDEYMDLIIDTYTALLNSEELEDPEAGTYIVSEEGREIEKKELSKTALSGIVDPNIPIDGYSVASYAKLLGSKITIDNIKEYLLFIKYIIGTKRHDYLRPKLEEYGLECYWKRNYNETVFNESILEDENKQIKPDFIIYFVQTDDEAKERKILKLYIEIKPSLRDEEHWKRDIMNSVEFTYDDEGKTVSGYRNVWFAKTMPLVESYNVQDFGNHILKAIDNNFSVV